MMSFQNDAKGRKQIYNWIPARLLRSRCTGGTLFMQIPNQSRVWIIQISFKGSSPVSSQLAVEKSLSQPATKFMAVFPIISSLVSPLFPSSTPAHDERLCWNDLQLERMELNRGTFNKTDRLKGALQALMDAILLFSTPGVGQTPTWPEIIVRSLSFILRHILHH